MHVGIVMGNSHAKIGSLGMLVFSIRAVVAEICGMVSSPGCCRYKLALLMNRKVYY